MSRLNQLLALVGVACLCGFAFCVGRYSQRLSMAASGCSYRAFILEGTLRQMRAKNVESSAQAMEMRLDEEVATLARIRESTVGYRAFVPAACRDQVEVVLRRFMEYRSTVALSYTGAPMWHIDRFKDPSRELLDKLEEMNRQRARRNALVESVYEEFGGRKRPKDTGADAASAADAGAGGGNK